MNRSNVLIEISKFVVFSNNYRIAILLSSYEEVKQFNNDLTCLLDKIPQWLKPDLKYHISRNFRFENGTIYIVQSGCLLKGCTLNRIYKSSSLTDKKREEYREIEIIHVIINGSTNSIIEFTDAY